MLPFDQVKPIKVLNKIFQDFTKLNPISECAKISSYALVDLIIIPF